MNYSLKRICPRCKKQFEVDRYHTAQIYCNDCKYIKDKEYQRIYHEPKPKIDRPKPPLKREHYICPNCGKDNLLKKVVGRKMRFCNMNCFLEFSKKKREIKYTKVKRFEKKGINLF